MITTDLIIIGAGPGGYRAAEYAAQRGLKVVLFEGGQLGGTCLNEGCIPTKCYARHAELLLTLRDAETLALQNLHYDFDFRHVVARKNQVLDALRGGIATLLSHPNITLVQQPAAFVDAHTVTTPDGEQFAASHIIVATGSVPKQLRLSECAAEKVCDSNWLLHTEQLPARLCIVGAGVIGMEFASILHAFGVEVTVVEFLKECLPALDSDIAKRLRKTLEKRGVNFYMQSAVQAITHEGVTFERKGKQETIAADRVLVAVGRMPRVSDDFRLAGFDYDAKGIRVNDQMQTSVPHIYAIGDVNGRQLLAHAAEHQALIAVDAIVNASSSALQTPHPTPIPAAIFTHPEAACVGLSEDQCKEQAISYTCGKAFHRANGKALAMNETEGMVKLLAGADRRIIGCHAYGAHAADLVQEVSALMCRETTVEQLRHMVHIHPTLSELLLDAAQNA